MVYTTGKKRIYTFITAMVCLTTAVVVSGCVDPYAPKVISPLTTSTEIIGSSVQNRPVECLRFGNGPQAILFIASIHGDESIGTPLAYKLVEYLQKDRRMLQNRTILIIPVANPDGCAASTRENANEVDLNRNFPAANRINITEYGTHPLSEPEAVALKEVIQAYHPARVVSIHAPLSCIDYDGPGQAIAENMARVCDLPVTKLGAHPGSLGAYVGESLGIPVLTLELRETDRELSADELWAKYGRSLVAAIVYPEILY